MPDNELGQFFTELKKVAQKLKDKLTADGFNIIQNNYPAGRSISSTFSLSYCASKERR